MCGRAQRRLARHAARARIRVVSRALVVDDCVDVEEVAGEVLEAETERISAMAVSSDEEGELAVTSAPIFRVRDSAPAPTEQPQAWRARAASRSSSSHDPGASSSTPQVSDAAVQTWRGTAERETRTPAPSEWDPSGQDLQVGDVSSGLLETPISSSPNYFDYQVDVESWSPMAGRAAPAPSRAPDPYGLPALVEEPVVQLSFTEGPVDLEEAEPSAPRALPAWFDQDVSHGPDTFASLYVEPVRPGMEPRHCRFCRGPFAYGQLRLGYTPCGVSWDARPFPPVWVHAVHCAQRSHLAIRQGAERVCFSPSISVALKDRILNELSHLRASAATARDSTGNSRQSQSHLCIRPWRYLPAVMQHWVSQAVPERPPPPPAPPPPPPETTFSAPLGMAAVPTATWSLEVGHLDRVRELHGSLRAVQVQHMLAQLLDEVSVNPPMPRMPWPGRPFSPPRTGFSSEPPQEGSGIEAMLREVPTCSLDKAMDDPCVVCREPLEPGQTCRRLPCFHIFHQECIDRWLCTKATCPLDNLKLSDMLSKQRALEASERGGGGWSNARSRSRSRSRHRRRRTPTPPRMRRSPTPHRLRREAAARQDNDRGEPTVSLVHREPVRMRWGVQAPSSAPMDSSQTASSPSPESVPPWRSNRPNGPYGGRGPPGTWTVQQEPEGSALLDGYGPRGAPRRVLPPTPQDPPPEGYRPRPSRWS